jgi:hypothetical protein
MLIGLLAAILERRSNTATSRRTRRGGDAGA